MEKSTWQTPRIPADKSGDQGSKKAAVISGSALAPPLTIDPLIIIELQRKWILARGRLEVGSQKKSGEKGDKGRG